MRILLASAVAIAPLMVATGSQAEIVISNARTTPIQTSNATGTGPDNIRLASGGSVAVTSGAAVTLNSNHTVDLDSGSSITMDKSADGSTGLLVNGGNTGSVIVGGSITVNDTQESADVKDTDGDGDLDGPFATGTGRYGVRVVGPAPFTGNVLVESTGAITVEGANSYGLAVETGLNGKLQSLGTIRVTGDNTAGVRTTGPVSGNVELSGAISALGANATGVSIEGDVGGAVKIHSSVVATGYRYTTPPPARPTTGAFDNATTLFLDELDADDLLQGGPAVRVGANVAGGVLLDKALAYSAAGIEGDDDGDGIKNGDEDDDGDGVKNRDDPDRNGNGIPDASETTASITSLGGAPALLVGSTTQAVNLGAVGTGDAAYGLINRGSITASGLYSGIESRAVQLGVTGGQAVNVAGGVRNEGGVSLDRGGRQRHRHVDRRGRDRPRHRQHRRHPGRGLGQADPERDGHSDRRRRQRRLPDQHRQSGRLLRRQSGLGRGHPRPVRHPDAAEQRRLHHRFVDPQHNRHQPGDRKPSRPSTCRPTPAASPCASTAFPPPRQHGGRHRQGRRAGRQRAGHRRRDQTGLGRRHAQYRERRRQRRHRLRRRGGQAEHQRRRRGDRRDQERRQPAGHQHRQGHAERDPGRRREHFQPERRRRGFAAGQSGPANDRAGGFNVSGNATLATGSTLACASPRCWKGPSGSTSSPPAR